MLTNPARIPLHTTPGSNLWSRKKFKNIVVVPETVAAMVVVTPILAAALETGPPRLCVEPQLKPYQPNHRISVPA